MDGEYTQEYEQFELRHWWFAARRRVLHNVLDRVVGDLEQPGRADAEGVRWLDVGCGTGVLLNSYDRVPRARKVGLELDGPSVARAQTKGLDVRQVEPKWDFADLGTFDLVTLCDVLEHLEHEQEALDEIHARLRPGGVLVATVPALMSLWSPHDEVNHHFRRYRRPQLRGLFTADRWAVRQCSYFCSLLLPMIFAVRKIKNLKQRRSGEAPVRHDFKFGNRLIDGTLERIFGLERHLMRLAPLPLGSSLLIVAQKLPGQPTAASRVRQQVQRAVA